MKISLILRLLEIARARTYFSPFCNFVQYRLLTAIMSYDNNDRSNNGFSPQWLFGNETMKYLG